MSIERRRAPRIEILGRLHGTTVAFDMPVLVREISIGGMSVETDLPLVPGGIHEFLLTLGDGSTVELTGRVLRCQQVAGADGPERHVSGIQFIDEHPDEAPAPSEQVIDRLL